MKTITLNEILKYIFRGVLVMCGFIGILKKEENIWGSQDRAQFEERNNIIYYRGPDDEDYYEDENIIFGFRRLSIIDLEGGQQPFTFHDERYWMVFNGEIYNYIELKEQLQEQGVTFTTDSDIEVIITMFHK